ncbi:LSU ribosomal protein L29p (L35e) [hydrothermal vent metagenome]|uniref:LSU ribosomal protein L29p (L35e) n=1 Tax=hydrothermal vent metagenome TaxID=652676 RepID=A0A3B1C8D4_9ZZZZ
MKFEKLNEMTEDEISLKFFELKESYMKLRFQHATAQLDSSAKLRDTRRDIARVNTLINQRKKEAAKAGAEG